MFILTKKSAIIASFFLLSLVFSSFLIKWSVFKKINEADLYICPNCHQVVKEQDSLEVFLWQYGEDGRKKIQSIKCTSCEYIFKKDCKIEEKHVK